MRPVLIVAMEPSDDDGMDALLDATVNELDHIPALELERIPFIATTKHADFTARRPPTINQQDALYGINQYSIPENMRMESLGPVTTGNHYEVVATRRDSTISNVTFPEQHDLGTTDTSQRMKPAVKTLQLKHLSSTGMTRCDSVLTMENFSIQETDAAPNFIPPPSLDQSHHGFRAEHRLSSTSSLNSIMSINSSQKNTAHRKLRSISFHDTVDIVSYADDKSIYTQTSELLETQSRNEVVSVESSQKWMFRRGGLSTSRSSLTSIDDDPKVVQKKKIAGLFRRSMLNTTLQSKRKLKRED